MYESTNIYTLLRTFEGIVGSSGYFIEFFYNLIKYQKMCHEYKHVSDLGMWHTTLMQLPCVAKYLIKLNRAHT